MEIERKYLVKQLPGDLTKFKNKIIEQGYLCSQPTIHIRKSNDDYILTYKSKLGVEREETGTAIMNHEVELPLTKEAYYSLREKVDGNLVYKTRYLIPMEEGLIAELDIFEGKLKGLIFTEVEFPDEHTANQFVPPHWFGRELSSDHRFSNNKLSKLSSLDELNLKYNE